LSRISAKEAKIQREAEELEAILLALPQNPFPWATALRLIAPVLVRLAIRSALKRVKRGMAEDKVKSVTDTVTRAVISILDKRFPNQDTTGDGKGQ